MTLHRTGTFTRSMGAPGFQLLRARNVTFPKPLQLVHTEYAIKLTLEGYGAPIRYQGVEHDPCSVGNITVFEPFEPVTSKASECSTSFISLLIDPHVVNAASDALGYCGNLRVAAAHLCNPRLAQEIIAINHDIASGVPFSALESSVTSVLESLLNLKDEDHIPSVDSAVLRVREMILDRIVESVSLDEMELTCGLSRFHLVRMFRRHFGMPPHEFHTHARVAIARTLLAKGYSQAEVAQEVGFFDQSHLHRHFRKIMGISPGAFQRCLGK